MSNNTEEEKSETVDATATASANTTCCFSASRKAVTSKSLVTHENTLLSQVLGHDMDKASVTTSAGLSLCALPSLLAPSPTYNRCSHLHPLLPILHHPGTNQCLISLQPTQPVFTLHNCYHPNLLSSSSSSSTSSLYHLHPYECKITHDFKLCTLPLKCYLTQLSVDDSKQLPKCFTEHKWNRASWCYTKISSPVHSLPLLESRRNPKQTMLPSMPPNWTTSEPASKENSTSSILQVQLTPTILPTAPCNSTDDGLSLKFMTSELVNLPTKSSSQTGTQQSTVVGKEELEEEEEIEEIEEMEKEEEYSDQQAHSDLALLEIEPEAGMESAKTRERDGHGLLTEIPMLSRYTCTAIKERRKIYEEVFDHKIDMPTDTTQTAEELASQVTCEEDKGEIVSAMRTKQVETWTGENSPTLKALTHQHEEESTSDVLCDSFGAENSLAKPSPSHPQNVPPPPPLSTPLSPMSFRAFSQTSDLGLNNLLNYAFTSSITPPVTWGTLFSLPIEPLSPASLMSTLDQSVRQEKDQRSKPIISSGLLAQIPKHIIEIGTRGVLHESDDSIAPEQPMRKKRKLETNPATEATDMEETSSYCLAGEEAKITDQEESAYIAYLPDTTADRVVPNTGQEIMTPPSNSPILPSNQSPVETPDDGSSALKQALPTDKARLHALVPSLTQCNRRGGGEGGEGGGGGKRTSRNESRDNDSHQHTGYPWLGGQQPFQPADLACKDRQVPSLPVRRVQLEDTNWIPTPSAANRNEEHQTPPTLRQATKVNLHNPISSLLDSHDFQLVPGSPINCSAGSVIFSEDEGECTKQNELVSEELELDSLSLLGMAIETIEEQKHCDLFSTSGCTSDHKWSKNVFLKKVHLREPVEPAKLNLSKPRLRIGLSKRQPCKPLHGVHYAH